MALPRSRAKQFAQWDYKPVKDHDIEADQPPSDDDEDSGSDQAANDTAATEHYVAVGKSKLRRKADINLGPEYHGKRVSREALEQTSDHDPESDSESGEYEDAREALSEEVDDEDDEEEDEEDVAEEDGEFDDPDDADLERDAADEDPDAEIDSDNAFGESDEERFEGFVFRGSSQALPVRGKRVERPKASDFLEDEAEESEDGDDADDLSEEYDSEEDDDEGSMADFLDDGDEDMLDDDDVENGAAASSGDDPSEQEESDNSSEEEDGSDEDDIKKPISKSSRKAALSEMMSAESRVADSLASSILKDVAKGLAVRQQQKSFDAALNIRIRLQKALVGINTMNVIEDTDGNSEAYEGAESAAIKLWSSLREYRTSMQASAGQKRKRDVDVTTSSQDIWDDMQELERAAATRRINVLENWSSKAKKMRTTNDAAGGKGVRNLVKVEKPLTMMLEEQMEVPERLIKRTRTPRSCAPTHVSQKVNEDPNIYDDADFYQLLLKDLVDQRSSDTSTSGQAAIIRYAAVKEAKTKKQVDTKASKGRKMRFNVHEKIQNFMAPEDRRSWEQHAIDRFFGTLFGQKMVLNEDEASDEEVDDMKIEEDGLKLFRS